MAQRFGFLTLQNMDALLARGCQSGLYRHASFLAHPSDEKRWSRKTCDLRKALPLISAGDEMIALAEQKHLLILA